MSFLSCQLFPFTIPCLCQQKDGRDRIWIVRMGGTNGGSRSLAVTFILVDFRDKGRRSTARQQTGLGKVLEFRGGPAMRYFRGTRWTLLWPVWLTLCWQRLVGASAYSSQKGAGGRSFGRWWESAKLLRHPFVLGMWLGLLWMRLVLIVFQMDGTS